MNLPTGLESNAAKQVAAISNSVDQSSVALVTLQQEGAIAADKDAQFLVDGKPFSVIPMLTAKELEDAQKLADGTYKDVRGANRQNIANIGLPALVGMDDITNKALTRARQRDLDAINKPGNDLMKEVEEGLNLDIKYHDPTWLEKIGLVNHIQDFLKRVESLEMKLDRLTGNLRSGDGKLIERISDFTVMKGKYVQQIGALYVYTAAAEIVLEREVAYLNDLKKQGAQNKDDTRIAYAIDEQQTIVTRLRKRTFFLLGEALKSYLRVGVIEESIKAAEIAHDSVMETIYGVVKGLKEGLTILLGQWDTAQTAAFAHRVNQMGLKVDAKLAESIGTANAILQVLTEDQKAQVQSCVATKDALVSQIKWGIELDKQLAENYQLLGDTTKKITDAVQAALSQIEETPA
ncbi:MAG TPA: toxic anion resistance protein [Patescibacteria group bacterium]